MEKIKIMVAEDQPVYRNVLATGLNTSKIKVIGVAADGLELIELVKKEIPDIVILDLRMPNMNGVEVLKVFTESFKTIKTIVISQDYSEFIATDLIINGVAAYQDKHYTDMSELITIIEKVDAEGYFFNDNICLRILKRLKTEKRFHYSIENKKYSLREIDVLRLLCAEKTIPQIGDELGITANTVLYHKRQLFDKTESTTIVALVKFAVRQCIINGKGF